MDNLIGASWAGDFTPEMGTDGMLANLGEHAGRGVVTGSVRHRRPQQQQHTPSGYDGETEWSDSDDEDSAADLYHTAAPDSLTLRETDEQRSARQTIGYTDYMGSHTDPLTGEVTHGWSRSVGTNGPIYSSMGRGVLQHGAHPKLARHGAGPDRVQAGRRIGVKRLPMPKGDRPEDRAAEADAMRRNIVSRMNTHTLENRHIRPKAPERSMAQAGHMFRETNDAMAEGQREWGRRFDSSRKKAIGPGRTRDVMPDAVAPVALIGAARDRAAADVGSRRKKPTQRPVRAPAPDASHIAPAGNRNVGSLARPRGPQPHAAQTTLDPGVSSAPSRHADSHALTRVRDDARASHGARSGHTNAVRASLRPTAVESSSSYAAGMSRGVLGVIQADDEWGQATARVARSNRTSAPRQIHIPIARGSAPPVATGMTRGPDMRRAIPIGGGPSTPHHSSTHNLGYDPVLPEPTGRIPIGAPGAVAHAPPVAPSAHTRPGAVSVQRPSGMTPGRAPVVAHTVSRPGDSGDVSYVTQSAARSHISIGQTHTVAQAPAIAMPHETGLDATHIRPESSSHRITIGSGAPKQSSVDTGMSTMARSTQAVGKAIPIGGNNTAPPLAGPGETDAVRAVDRPQPAAVTLTTREPTISRTNLTSDVTLQPDRATAATLGSTDRVHPGVMNNTRGSSLDAGQITTVVQRPPQLDRQRGAVAEAHDKTRDAALTLPEEDVRVEGGTFLDASGRIAAISASISERAVAHEPDAAALAHASQLVPARITIGGTTTDLHANAGPSMSVQAEARLHAETEAWRSAEANESNEVLGDGYASAAEGYESEAI